MRRRPLEQSRGPRKFRVLFVCIGNAVRSQMAEAFARSYGRDVIDPFSAGVSPASMIAPLTAKVLRDRGIDLGNQYPKSIVDAPGAPWDYVINMSGQPLATDGVSAKMREWTVRDPIGGPEAGFVAAAAQIESLVMKLIIELRGAMKGPAGAPGRV